MNWILEMLLRIYPGLLKNYSPTCLETAFFYAPAWISPLLEYGIDVNIPLKNGLLHQAMLNRIRLPDLKALLARCDGRTLNARAGNIGTPFMSVTVSAWWGAETERKHNREMVSLLIEYAHGDGSGVLLDEVEDDLRVTKAKAFSDVCTSDIRSPRCSILVKLLPEILAEFTAARRRIQEWQDRFHMELATWLLPLLKAKPVVDLVGG
jgi:hypothetical protein